MRIPILFFAFLGLVQSSHQNTTINETVILQKAELILEKMDKALESHDFKEFLAMHDENFHFNFCQVNGSSVKDLERVLKTDPNMARTVTSKHTVQTSISKSPVRNVADNKWEFEYEEHLLLKDKQVVRTEGTISFLDLEGTRVKIVSAEEKCPEKVFD
ncbi:hypothetical protein CRE_12278 [Caenorhabditis remanei]|uniref:Uncharacterized protein n=1 Tax=Caenorhabditis remanei TaxID=31234 RepID=E3NBB1_CAERE|nr:hypothetical protein CRE_12278 [Caenorhabditis remanei]